MPLFWISLAFLSGIILGSVTAQPVLVWLILSGLSLALLFAPGFVGRISDKLPAFFISPLIASSILIPFVLCVFFLGAARYQSSLPTISPEFIAFYNDTEEEIVVTGIVTAPPDVRDSYINLRVEVERIRFDSEISYTQVNGLLLARVPTDGKWHYGDRVIVRGYLETPPENEEFSYRNYLANQGIYSFMPFAKAALLESQQGNSVKHIIFSIKENALDFVYRLFPDPEASLFAGILLGVESGISSKVKGAFNLTGVSHIIAISGFNIAILAGLFTKNLSRWLGVRKGAALAAAIIALYTLLVGGDAAVVRAAIMGWIGLAAQQVGRRQSGINSLAFVAALMAINSPQVLWDVGFQLSFAATLGLVLYADPLSAAFNRFASPRLSEEILARIAKPVGDYFLFTIAATFTTLPIILFYFQRLSLTSLPANLAILPAQPPLMILGGIAVILTFVYYPLGQLVAYFAWPLAAYTIRVVEWFASFPGGALVAGQMSTIIVILFYLILFAITIWGEKIRSYLPALRPTFIFLFVAALTALAWQNFENKPDGLLHATILDVGTGDAILIESPTGRYVLIGGGPSSVKLSESLGRRLPFFRRKLDFLVIAAPREEQVAALPFMIARFPPARVLWAGPANASRSARFLQSELTAAAIPITLAQAGDVLDLGAGVRLELLATSRRGAVLLLTWDNFRLLMPLGMDFENLEDFEYGKIIGPVSALLLADNGFAPLNPREWIDNLRPQIVLLGVAAGNYDGLPSQELLEYVQAYSLRRTDQYGWIALSTDGNEMWVEVERAWADNK